MIHRGTEGSSKVRSSCAHSSLNGGFRIFISRGLSIGEGALLKIRKIPPEEIGQH